MNHLAYVRVSGKAQSYETQVAAIERMAAAHGDVIVDWYCEKKSGKNLDRLELQRLLADGGAGKLRGRKLYLFRLDRLTRSGIRDTLDVVHKLRDAGCTPVSVTDGFALSGPTADVVLSVLAFAAQVELLAKNERVAAARTRLEAEGRPWGRPSRLSAGERAKILAMRAEGRSFRKIAVAMKVPLATVARACRKGGTKTIDPLPSNDSPQQVAFGKYGSETEAHHADV